MNLSWTSLSQTVARRFRPRRRKRASWKRNYTRCNRRFEKLEDRSVLSATFGSALTVGNETEGSAIFDVAADSAGNSYVSGLFRGTVDFDLTSARADGSDIATARGSADAFVAKYASDDSLIWVRPMGGDSVSGNVSDVARKLAVDNSGGVYVVGEFSEAADFGNTTLNSMGSYDGFIAKLDAAGQVEWAKRWGNAAADSARGVDVDSAGNVYALGGRIGDAYDIMKFSPNGAGLWSKSIATRSYHASADLAVNAEGQVFVAGSFSGTVDFDPGTKTKYVSSGATGSGGFVLKLDTKGQFNWVSPFIGANSPGGAAAAMSIALDTSSNVIVGGSFSGTVDFNPGSGTTYLSTQSGGFITKLNSSGGLVWARALHGNASTFVYGLDTDAAGNIYATGSFNGSIDLDPSAGAYPRTTGGQADILVVKLTAAGSFAWAETFGGTGTDVCFGVAVDASGIVHLAGYFRDTVDFDPDPFATYDLTSAGDFTRGFRLRLQQP